jgi:hypothetical protein
MDYEQVRHDRGNERPAKSRTEIGGSFAYSADSAKRQTIVPSLGGYPSGADFADGPRLRCAATGGCLILQRAAQFTTLDCRWPPA